MIPGAFDYHRPRDIGGVLALLAEHGDDARVIAGGHSLVPMMKLRVAEVPHLIDLQDVESLKGIGIENGCVTIGAMVTQHELVNDAMLFEAAPILREAALQIADPQVRYMGTIGGNVANGDPGNDMPGVLQCLDAQLVLRGPDGEREVAARDFYEAAFTTKRHDSEILTKIRFGIPKGGSAYEKQKRKIGDYATAAAAVVLAREGNLCSAASIAMTNLSDTPVWSATAAEALVGSMVDDAAISKSVDCMLNDIDPVEDNRGSIAFKHHVAGIILSRAIKRAWNGAEGRQT